MNEDNFVGYIACCCVGAIVGVIFGIVAATEYQHERALKAGAAYYSTQTGDFHYGILK